MSQATDGTTKWVIDYSIAAAGDNVDHIGKEIVNLRIDVFFRNSLLKLYACMNILKAIIKILVGLRKISAYTRVKQNKFAAYLFCIQHGAIGGVNRYERYMHIDIAEDQLGHDKFVIRDYTTGITSFRDL